MLLDRGLVLFGLGGGLPLLQLGHRFLQHLRDARSDSRARCFSIVAALRRLRIAARARLRRGSAKQRGTGGGEKARSSRSLVLILVWISRSLAYCGFGGLTLTMSSALDPGGRADREAGLGARGELRARS